jgi:hypothetical protein
MLTCTSLVLVVVWILLAGLRVLTLRQSVKSIAVDKVLSLLALLVQKVLSLLALLACAC